MIFLEKFQLSKFANEGAALLRDVTNEFNRLGIETSNLPKIFPDDSGKIKLVFVGQYSAGKSSLIKMLTGEDVKIGAAITTQDAKSYDWNGLEIVDTPGIETNLNPDHDKKTYDQINHAAFLIFVITNEGFSQLMGDHFRKLAIEQNRASDMVLVVNKMDCTALGNVPEQQKIICEDLKKVVAPYDPEKDLYISFVDALSYLKAMKESDASKKSRRLKRSGYDNFVSNMNNFVAQKGKLQKLKSPLNTIAAEIRKTLSNSSDKGNANDNAIIENYQRQKKIIVDSKRECIEDIKDIINNFKTKVSQRGRETADKAMSQGNADDAKKVLSDAQDRVKKYAEDCIQEITDRIKLFADQCDKKLTDYAQSPFVKQIQANIANGMNVQGSSEVVQGGAVAVGAGGVAFGALAFQNGAQLAAQFAQPATQIVTSELGVFAGDVTKLFFGDGMGNLVKSLPLFQKTIVGEATNLNKFASLFTGNVSKILGGALAGGAVIASILMIRHEDNKAKEAERKRQQARSEIILGFNDIAEDIARDIDKHIREFMTQQVEPILKKFDKQIDNEKVTIENQVLQNAKLSVLLKCTENLIEEIQTCK